MSNSKKKKPKPFTKRTSAAAPKPLSKLEQLPDELLLDIFAESENASLLFTSQRLHEIANYTGTHKKLITLCCKDPGLSSRSRHHAHDNLRMLMQEKWLSLGWLWEAGCDWIADCVQSEFAEFSRALETTVGISEESKAAHHRRMQESLSDLTYTRPGFRWYDDGIACWEIDRSVASNVAGNNYTSAWSFQTSGNLSFEQCSYIFRSDQAYRVGRRANFRFDVVRSYFFVKEIKSFAAFPDKFLRGPWSQSEGDILSFFMARVIPGHANVPSRGRMITSMESGLMTAVREECLPALAIFGGNLNDALLPELIKGDPDPKIPWVIPPSHPVFQKTVDESPWSKPNIVVKAGTIPGLLWQAEHVDLLLKKAIGKKRGDVWPNLDRELQLDLKRRQRRRMVKAPELLHQIDAFQDVHQTDKDKLGHKYIRSKKYVTGFAL